jgi:hypothetical protein
MDLMTLPGLPTSGGAELVPRGARLALLSTRDAGAPPKVVVSGPDGTRIETPAGPRGIGRGGLLLAQDPATSTPQVVATSHVVRRTRLRVAAGARVRIVPLDAGNRAGAARTARVGANRRR